MKRFLIALQTLLIPLLMSAQINMSVNGRAELDPQDNDARSYYALRDANDLDCAIIKVSLNNPVNGTLVLQTKGGAATVKSEKQANGEWWFWVSPVVTNIMFSCEGYTPTGYVGVTLKGKSVYRLKLTVDAAVATVTTFTLGESVMKLNVNPPDATVFYGKTKDCDMGSRVLTDGLFEAFLDKGTYYYRIESRFYEQASGKYEVTDDSPEQNVSLKPAFSYLSLDTNPQGAEVYVNGRLIGTTPVAMSDKIRRGTDVRIEFRKEDYYIEPVKVDIIGDGKVQTVPTVNLRPQFGWVTCVCEDPDATITVRDATKVIATGHSGMRVKLNSGGMSYKLESSKPSHVSQAQGIKGSTIEGKDIKIVVDKPVPIYGGLQITSSPSRAKVYIDGEEAGTTAFSKRVLIGQHTVELKLDGYHLDPFTVNIREGRTEQLAKTLVKGPREVMVTVYTDPGCTILMDGVSMGPDNSHKIRLEVGRRYLFESELEYVSLRFHKGELYYTPTAEDNQSVKVPAAKLMTGTLKVTTGNVKAAKVKVTGKEWKEEYKSPVNHLIPIGTYTVTASQSGYRDATATAKILDGKTTTLNLTMHKQLVAWKWGWEETEFAKHFLDYEVGIMEDGPVLGLQYAYCKKHLGFYARYLAAIGEETSSVSAGPVLRLTWDYRKVDWQVYAGGGLMYETPGVEFGTRFGWHSGNFSWFDFGMGVQMCGAGIIPVFSVGLGIAFFPYYLIGAAFKG